LPVDGSPANIVILLEGMPPNNEPDTTAFKTYDPVPMYDDSDPADLPVDASEA